MWSSSSLQGGNLRYEEQLLQERRYGQWRRKLCALRVPQRVMMSEQSYGYKQLTGFNLSSFCFKFPRRHNCPVDGSFSSYSFCYVKHCFTYFLPSGCICGEKH